ncbi:hypothetical protein [Bartonella sp. CB178]|uniref:hypothetical protein n=1 Tax=Bartonella sp. CB178 TaxID=3112255 RepID=UPI00300E37A9
MAAFLVTQKKDRLRCGFGLFEVCAENAVSCGFLSIGGLVKLSIDVDQVSL